MKNSVKLICLSMLLIAPAHAMDNNDFNHLWPAMDPKETQCLQLIEAALNGNNEKIKELIELGVPLDYTHNSGAALGFAIARNHSTCAQTLIAAGAPANQRFGPDEFTPLILATAYGNAECVQALIAAGANVNLKDKKCKTAIMLAASKGDLTCLQMLLKAGAKVNEVDEHGERALTFAILRENLHCIQPLIAAGSRINFETYNGWTPLMFAIEFTNDADCAFICDQLIDAMLHMPTREQKAQIITLLGIDTFKKKLSLDKYLQNELKKALRMTIYRKNKENFAGSIAYQELMRIKDLSQTKDPSSQQRIAALLEKYNPGGNNAGSTSWCSVQ